MRVLDATSLDHPCSGRLRRLRRSGVVLRCVLLASVGRASPPAHVAPGVGMQIYIRLKTGRTLTLEVEGSLTAEELKAMIEAKDGSLVAAEHSILVGEGEGSVLAAGMTLAEGGVRKEAELRLVPRQRPPPDPSEKIMDDALAALMQMRAGMRGRWDEHHDSVAALESRKRALVQQHGGGRVKDRLKLTVGGEHVNTKRSTLCTPFPGSNLDAVFSGRWENALLRDPKDKKRIFIGSNPECFRMLVEFCVDNQGHQPGEPLELPEVAPELEATLHLTFRLFGLDYLFEAKEDAMEEAVPPHDQEPEPEDEAEEGEAAAEVEIIVREGAAVSLPPRTVDRIVGARYGSLDVEGKWIDVTGVVAEELTLEGALELSVDNGTMGLDPHKDAEKSLSIRYVRCQPWERTPSSDLCSRFNAATEGARRALREAIAKHEAAVRQFEQEQAWIQPFLATKPAPAAPEVVQIDLLGEKICVKRKTLMLCADSALARQFDAAAWAQQAAGGGGADGSESDSDEDDAGVVFIEQNAYCFKKMVDQLQCEKRIFCAPFY
eukprot:COSAG06_NODE_778_length_12377_cov_54.670875_4_plen_548_part_00